MGFVLLAGAALYFANAGLSLVIVGVARNGPTYWPALTLSALTSGVPGVFLFCMAASKLTPLPDPSLTSYRAGLVAVYALCVALQALALVRVVRSNKEYFAWKHSEARRSRRKCSARCWPRQRRRS